MAVDFCGGGAQAAGMLQVLALGWLSYRKAMDPKLDVTDIVRKLMAKFDGLRVTKPLLDALQGAGCAGAAEALAKAAPQFPTKLALVYGQAAGVFAPS
eukprot:4161438-Pyramimonas_sp.AAC.1